jgi:flagellar basal-body rod protein FlgB
MNLPDIPMLSMLRERMSWLNTRQSVLSQNVANVDTPGYTARDLKPVDFEAMLRDQSDNTKFHVGLVTTNDKHIAIAPSSSDDFSGVDTPDVDANPSGNSVSLEQEMIKVADTQMQFQAATNLYAKAMNLMRTAIGKPGS